jgi:cobalt-zinc-cadmium efflux system protein
MAHTHAPAPSTSVNPAAHQRRLIATLTVTGSVFLIEVVSAVLTGSLALLVDAGHMLTDMSVLAASTITAILMRRKPSNTRTWGWARLEVLTAAAGAVRGHSGSCRKYHLDFHPCLAARRQHEYEGRVPRGDE